MSSILLDLLNPVIETFSLLHPKWHFCHNSLTFIVPNPCDFVPSIEQKRRNRERISVLNSWTGSFLFVNKISFVNYLVRVLKNHFKESTQKNESFAVKINKYKNRKEKAVKNNNNNIKYYCSMFYKKILFQSLYFKKIKIKFNSCYSMFLCRLFICEMYRAFTNDFFGNQVIGWLFWRFIEKSDFFSGKKNRCKWSEQYPLKWLKIHINNEAIIIGINKASKASNHMVLLKNAVKTHNVISCTY